MDKRVDDDTNLNIPEMMAEVGAKARAAAADATMARDYWDWDTRLQPESYRWFCGTAPEHLLFALREALDMIQEEGLENIWARHQIFADAVRAAVEAWSTEGGLEFNIQDPADTHVQVSDNR